MILDFLFNFGKLKNVPRTGWLLRGINRSDVESVADHSNRVALICLIITNLIPERVDRERIFKMAVLHDLSETLLLDIDKQVANLFGNELKRRAEQSVENHIMKDLPPKLKKEYIDLLSEYHQGKTLESRIIKFSDKLETILQALEYEKKGYSRETVKDFYDDLTNLDEFARIQPIKEMIENIKTMIKTEKK